MDVVDGFVDRFSGRVHHEHVALDQTRAGAAQRFDNPLHAAGDRRIELADVQHALQTSAATRAGTGRPATAQ
jgi:hypothetical protein